MIAFVVPIRIWVLATRKLDVENLRLTHNFPDPDLFSSSAHQKETRQAWDRTYQIFHISEKGMIDRTRRLFLHGSI